MPDDIAELDRAAVALPDAVAVNVLKEVLEDTAEYDGVASADDELVTVDV